jgi:hypothetical protein
LLEAHDVDAHSDQPSRPFGGCDQVVQPTDGVFATALCDAWCL